MEEIKNTPIKLGFKELDKHFEKGIEKNKIYLITGLKAQRKSSLLNQEYLQVVEDLLDKQWNTRNNNKH